MYSYLGVSRSRTVRYTFTFGRDVLYVHICIIVQYLVEVDRLPVTYGHEASLTKCLPKISRALAFVKLSSTNASVEIVIH